MKEYIDIVAEQYERLTIDEVCDEGIILLYHAMTMIRGNLFPHDDVNGKPAYYTTAIQSAFSRNGYPK